MRARGLLETLDELRIERLAVRLRLREIHLADVFRLLRIGDRDAVLVGDVNAARLHVLDAADEVADAVKLDRAVDDAREVLAVIQDWIRDDRDELAARAGDRRARHIRLLCLAHLLDVVARRAVHVLALVAHGLAVHGRVSKHGKVLRRFRLVFRELADDLLFRRAYERAVHREAFDFHRMLLENLLDVIRRRPPDVRRDRVGVADERRARHIVADGEKHEEAAEEEWQKRRKEFCPQAVELHLMSLQKTLENARLPQTSHFSFS